MINFLIIPISALAYAFRGGQVFVTEWEKRLEWLTAQKNPALGELREIAELEKRWWPKKLRKPIYCVVTGAVFGLLAWDIWAGVIVAIGSLPVTITSPRPMFWGWQNVYRAEEVTNSLLGGWMHKAAEFVTRRIYE